MPTVNELLAQYDALADIPVTDMDLADQDYLWGKVEEVDRDMDILADRFEWEASYESA
jgi:hypothetical protein